MATKLRILNPKSTDTKYTGMEPDWTTQPLADQRQSALMRSFAWYNYHYDKKTVKQLILDWMLEHDAKNHKNFAQVPESVLPAQLGWMCRMHQRGLALSDSELSYVKTTISTHLQAVRASRKIIADPDVALEPKITIQDRLRARAEEISGELEGMYDDLVVSGSKMTAEFKPMAVIRGMNLPAQMISFARDPWQARLADLQAVQEGRDGDLVEAYSNFSKLQIRNLVRFVEQVLADFASYGQIKRVEKRPRKAKPVSPEHRARKFKHIMEFAELKLTGLPAARLVDCSEAWLYDTKKRKLMHVLADSHIGTVTVKNNQLMGLNETDSVQKTLRKPAESLKSLLAASKPNARKVFKDIKTTETVFNGRGTDNLIILRTW